MKKIKRTFSFIWNHPLGKRHRFRSTAQFLLWQFQTRITTNFIIKTFISPIRFYARRGLTGVTGNIYTGLHDFKEMGLLLHFLKPQDIFFDIGANVGSYTLLAAGICKAKCFTIEPVPETYRILKMNVELNKLYKNTTLINCGVSADTGFLTISIDEDTKNHVLLNYECNFRKSIEISVITVDSLLKVSNPALIKIDVEGYETKVLQGMKETLNSDDLKIIIIKLNGSGQRYGYDDLEIHKLLISKGFFPHSYDPFLRLLKVQSDYGNLNTIYCKDTEFIKQRLKSALPIKVFGESI